MMKQQLFKYSKLIVTMLIITLIVLTVVSPENSFAASQLTNPSFEMGDLSGWNTYIPAGGSIQVVTNGADFDAVEGSYFALLKTNGPSTYTTISQSFSVEVGDKITGWAFFNAADYMPYNDNTQVSIKSNNTVIATVFEASVASVGDYGQTPWTSWEYLFTTAGTYTVEARIANEGDSVVDSFMGLDGVMFHIPDIEDLATVVTGLSLPQDIEDGLLDKVKAAQAALDRGKTTPATNILNAFINQVEAQRGKKITDEDATMLISFAQNIIASN